MRVRSLVLPSVLALGLLGAAGSDAADDEASRPRLDVLRIDSRGPDIRVKFHLEGALNPELARRIEAGLETAIRYDVRLYRRYRWWFDRLLDARGYRVAVTFDPVTREYVIGETLDGKSLRRTSTRDFSAVARMLVSGENLLVFRVGEGKPRRNLYVSMRATFDSGYLFTFIPVDARTAWKKSPRFDIRTESRENQGRNPEAP